MKVGIIGLPGSGRSTVFEALTGREPEGRLRGEDSVSFVRAQDIRVDFLSEMYMPEKTVYAQVKYLLPGRPQRGKDKGAGADPMAGARDCDAFLHVVRNFGGFGSEKPTPGADFASFDQEMTLADLISVEKRLERLTTDRGRGREIDERELSALKRCLEKLENGSPLRRDHELEQPPALRGFAFLSARPMLVLFNNEDEDGAPPELDDLNFKENSMIIRGRLEKELAQMSEDEARDFLEEFKIESTAKERAIKRSYELLGLMSFFTVGKDEVRAWRIKSGASAAEAAGVIHSDFKKGFIRAEVISFEDLVSSGTYAEARKKGKVRLEGKTYQVCDGDIINFRFNV